MKPNNKCLLLGLRCRASDTCQSWRWTKPDANLYDPEMKCDITNGCQHRRCLLMAGEIRNVQEWRPNLPNINTFISSNEPWPFRFPAFSSISNNFISGAKNCYKQMLGQTDGCFSQDLKFDETCGDVGEFLAGIKSWGECAAKCKSTSCLSWTWVSNACSNCKRENCLLFTGFLSCPNQLPKQAVAPGHISGEVSCEDIRYIETEDPTKVIPVPGNDDDAVECSVVHLDLLHVQLVQLSCIRYLGKIHR